MPIHWTEFPERVETFGDLCNILETLAYDLRADLIHSGSCAKESPASAYEVDFLRRGGEFVPRAERIPGWVELATYTEREFLRGPSVEVLKAVRGRASEVLDVPTPTINAMSVLQVVAALDEDRRRPADVGSPPPPSDITLGTLLIHALSAEQARENNRRAVERAAARSGIEAAMLSAQIAALNAGDPYANVPAAGWLRAYANNEFGQDFTPEVVRRIRGRVCEVLDIDTIAADALPLARVVEVLQAPSAPAEGGDGLERECRFLKVKEIAALFDLSTSQVTKLANAGIFVTNGKTEHDRRIDVLSVIRQKLKELNL